MPCWPMIHSTYSSISLLFLQIHFHLLSLNSSLSSFSIHEILPVTSTYKLKLLFSVVSDILLFAKFSDQLSVLVNILAVFFTLICILLVYSLACAIMSSSFNLVSFPDFSACVKNFQGFWDPGIFFPPIYWLYGVHILPYFIHYCCEYTYKIPSEPLTYKSNCLIEISTWIFYQASNVCKKNKIYLNILFPNLGRLFLLNISQICPLISIISASFLISYTVTSHWELPLSSNSYSLFPCPIPICSFQCI